jgi:hypothetical protein
MKKIILALAIAAAASMTIVGYASAGVERCEATVPVTTTVKTATFTMIQPANAYEQWSNVWTHDFTVTVNADNTFNGTGVQNGTDANYPSGYTANWTITGTFNADKTVSFTATRPVDGLKLTLTNAVMDNSTIAIATHNVPSVTLPIEEKLSAPTFESTLTTTPGTESVKNHGQFVKTQGGGKIAAQACAGMPLNSMQGQI